MRAPLVRIPLPVVLPTIEFDDDFRLAACKIHNKRTDDSLPPKMRTDQRDVVAKPLPKYALSIGRLCAHLPRKLSLSINHRVGFNHIKHRLWTPTPDPSPQGGGVKKLRELNKH